MFRVIVMFIALCRLPGRWLWEACHLAGRYSWTPGMGCDVTSEWNPRRCCGSSEEGGALLGRALAAQAQAGPLLFQPGWHWAKFWQPSSYLHSVLSSSRSDFSPTAWSVHRGRHPSLHGNWRGERFLAWNDGGKAGRCGAHTLANCRPVAGTWDLEEMTQGWRTICWQQRPWWTEAKLKQPHPDWAAPGLRKWHTSLRAGLSPVRARTPRELPIKPHGTWYSPKCIVWPLLGKNVSFPLPFLPCISHCWI